MSLSFRYWRFKGIGSGFIANYYLQITPCSDYHAAVPIATGTKTVQRLGSDACMDIDFGTATAVNSFFYTSNSPLLNYPMIVYGSNAADFSTATTIMSTGANVLRSYTFTDHIYPYLQDMPDIGAATITLSIGYPFVKYSGFNATVNFLGDVFTQQNYVTGYDSCTSFTWQYYTAATGTWTTITTADYGYLVNSDISNKDIGIGKKTLPIASFPTYFEPSVSKLACVVNQRGRITTATFNVDYYLISGSISGPTSGTLNTSYGFSINPSEGAKSGYTYAWSGTDGISGTGQSVNFSYATKGTKTITCVVGDGGVTPAQTFTHTIVIGDPPIVATLTANPTTGTTSTSFTYTLSGISGGIGTYSYAWSGTDSLTGATNATSVSKTYSTNGTKTAQCVITSGSSSLTVSVNVTVADPALTATISASPTSAATGANVTFSVTPAGGTGVYTYAWSGSDSSSSTSQSYTRSFATAGNKTLQCVITSGTQSITKTIDVAVSATPITGSITVTTSPVVLGNSVSLTMNASGGNGTYTYSWSDNDTPVLTGTTQSVTKTYASIGTKTVTCNVTSGGVTTPFTATVVVESPPALVVTLAASATTVVLNSNVVFTPTVSGGIGGYIYTWNGTDGKTGSGTTATFQWNTVGAKIVSVTVVSGTQNVTKEITINVVSVIAPILGRMCVTQ